TGHDAAWNVRSQPAQRRDDRGIERHESNGSLIGDGELRHSRKKSRVRLVPVALDLDQQRHLACNELQQIAIWEEQGALTTVAERGELGRAPRGDRTFSIYEPVER